MFARRKNRGFTFIELLVSLTIIALLAAIFIPRFVRARYRAYHSACMQNERTLATALESYQVDNKVYPDNLGMLVQAGRQYIQSLPHCPSDPATTYNSMYEVSPERNAFTISCPGMHNIQLSDVRDNYPQYNASGLMVDR